MRKLLSLISFASALTAPVLAQSNLQWRTTQCQVQHGNEIVAYGTCNAGFAYDTAVRAIKFTRKDGSKAYRQVGDAGVSFAGPDARECLHINFDDGTTELLCTVKTPEQLGITGD